MLLAFVKITLMDAYIHGYVLHLCYYDIRFYYMHVCCIYTGVSRLSSIVV